MKAYNLLIFIGCLLLLAITSNMVYGKNNSDTLADKKLTIRMKQVPLYTVMWRIVMEYDIAVGFEESEFDRGHRHYFFEPNVPQDPDERSEVAELVVKPSVPHFDNHLITLDFEDERLEVVLDSIVEQMDNYQWEIKEGVVNIFPVRGRDHRLVELLDTRVAEFIVGEGAEISAIKAQLMLDTPEFKRFLEEHGLDFDTTEPFSSYSNQVIREDMRFRDLTFRELLNSITKIKRGGWILQIKERQDKPGIDFVEVYI